MRRGGAAALARRIASIGAGLGLLGAQVVAPLGHSELVSASSQDSQTFNYTGQAQTFTVPTGVTQLSYIVAGGAGGGGYASMAGEQGGSGGDGTVVSGTLSVTPGEQLTIDVGSQGGNASSSRVSCGGANTQYDGGAAGSNPNASYDGGAGGNGECAPVASTGGGGGGGGAASVILDASNQALVVAAGGGGGGGAGEAALYDGGAGGSNSGGGNGSGTSAGAGGQQGSEASSSGGAGGTYVPPVALQDAGGGGGGGGGINGGAGGSPGGFGGGGGGGGGSGSSTSGTSITDTATNTGNGYVELSWTTPPPQPTLSASVSATSSPNPAYVGNNVTFSVSVSGSGSSSPVTGTAYVEAPGMLVPPMTSIPVVATVPINNGTGSVTLPVQDVATILQQEDGGASPYGVTSLPVVFYGSGSWQGVDASSSVGVDLSLDPTSTSLAVTPTPPVAGQPVTLTATVQNQAQASPGLPPSGTVSFTVTDAAGKTTTLGTASVSSSGKAILSGVTLPAGADTLTASYGGDGAHGPSSTSTTVVVKTPVSMSLVATPSSSSYGAAETLTASIPGQTQGSVTFSLIQGTSTQVLGSTPVTASGTAELVTSSLPVGTDEILAAFTPAGTSSGSSAFAVTTVTVVQDVPSISILGPTSVAPGSSEAYTIDVTANGQPVAGGSLQVQLGGTSFVTALGSDGVATVSLTFPATPGTQVISAMYLGSPTVAMASNTLSVTVAFPVPTTSGQSSSLPPTTSSSSSTPAASTSTASGAGSSTGQAPQAATAASSVSVPDASTGEPFASPWWWILSGLGVGAGAVGVATAWRRRGRVHRLL